MVSIDNLHSLTFIGRQAFYGTQWLANQPNGLVYIGDFLYTYKGTMYNNTNVVINDGTTRIVDGAFSGQSGLTSITIPNSVVYVGAYAFVLCSGLTSVTIPNSVMKIGGDAFAGEKSKIEDVYCYAERVPSLQDYICYAIARDPYSIYVEFIYKPLTLHVPKASIEQYKTHEWWNLKRGAPAAMVAGVPFLLQL